MKKLIYIPGIILAAFSAMTILASCDFLLPAPLGRDNLNDGGSQISYFGSFLTSEDDSVALQWNWRSYTGTDTRFEITKLRIVHREYDSPASMYPLDSSDVMEITTPDTIDKVWKNLKKYTDHVFAMYRMEKSGKWLAPIYTKIHLESGVVLESPSPPSLNYGYVDKVSGSTVQPTSVPLDAAYRGFLKITNNIDQYGGPSGLIKSSILKFTLNAANIDGSVQIVPMYIDIDGGELWDDISNPKYYDFKHAVSATVSKTVDVEVDIAPVLNRCLLYGTNTFSLIVDTGSINSPGNDISLQNISYWRQNN